MKHAVRTVAIAAFAFSLGILAARLPQTANAAAPPLTAATVDLTGMATADMPPPSTTFPDLRSKTVVVTDGMTAALQTGTAAKHYHANADEIQIVLEGTGTEVLGSQTVALKPGTMVIIPRGTNHAGLVATTPLKFVSLKTPPQDPADVHFVP